MAFSFCIYYSVQLKIKFFFQPTLVPTHKKVNRLWITFCNIRAEGSHLLKSTVDLLE